MVDSALQDMSASPQAQEGQASEKRVRFTLRLSSWLLVFAGYLALATVRGIGASILLIPMLLLLAAPIGEWFDARTKFYRILTKAATITYACFIPLSVMILGLTSGVIALVIFIQVYIMVHEKKEQDYLNLYLMAFFLLLAACVQTPEPAIALVMGLFIIGSIWAFLTLRLHVETGEYRALTPPEILHLNAGYSAGQVNSGSLFDTGLIASVAALSIAAVFLTGVIFMFVPRIEAGLFGRSQSETSVTGLDQMVDLTGEGFVEEDDTPVMYVRFPGLPLEQHPDPGDMYWRSTTLALYNNSQWTRSRLRRFMDPRLIFPERQGADGQARQEGNFGSRGDYGSVTSQPTPQTVSRLPRSGTTRIHQQIYMPVIPEQGIPALDLVQAVKVTSSSGRTRIRWDRYRDYSIMLEGRGDNQLDYEAWSEVGDIDPDDLRNADENFEEIFARFGMYYDYEILTSHNLLPETQELIQDITDREDNVYDKAKLLERWLSSGEFEYTLELPPLARVNTIDDFVLNVKKGHCELFASAMALALRSIGVPTRVVSGYRGGELDESDNSYIVRASMAHLWLEAWFPEFGWLKFDPSPSARELELSRFQHFSLMLSRTRLKAQMFWYREVVGFESGVQLERLKNFTMGFVRSFGSGEEEELVPEKERTSRTPFVRILVTGLVLFAAAMTIRKFLRRAKKTVFSLSSDQTRSVRLYKRLRRQLARHGIEAEGGTAGDLLDALEEDGGFNPEPVRQLVTTYNDVRFGKRPMDESRYKALIRHVRDLRPRTSG